MKLTVKQLRSLISEVAMSPSLKNNKPLSGPLDSKKVGELAQHLEGAFQNALATDLVVRAFDQHYNAQTREFDDDVYEHIKQAVESAKSQASRLVARALDQAWKSAHAEEPKAAQSGVHKVGNRAA
jgi:hypothetical protein